MKKGLKITFIICGIMLALGIGLLVAGILTGGVSSMVISLKDHKVYAGTSEKVTDEITPGEIDTLNLDVSNADVSIVEGTEYKVEYRLSKASTIETDYDESTKTFTFKEKNGGNYEITLFASNSSDTYVKVTVPEGTDMSSINVNLSYGDIDINKVSSASTNLNLSNGETTIESSDHDEVAISKAYGDTRFNGVKSKNIKVDSSYGDIKIKDSQIDDITLNSANGDIDMNDMILNNMDVSLNYGELKVEIKGNETDYNYDIQSDVGEIKINGTEVSHNYKKDGMGDNKIKVSSNVGDVDIEVE